MKFHQDEEFIKKVLVEVTSYIKVVEPKVRVDEIKSDPTDNIILEAALEAKADLIISGDKKHLLSLKEFEGIKIISAADFLKQT